MEKLIELLNQFEEEKKSDNRWGLSYVGNDLVWLWNIREARLAVISKEYWFIKRLVDNDKIDTQKFREKAKFLILSNSIKYYEFLIMELSIQKKPIKFLISVLK